MRRSLETWAQIDEGGLMMKAIGSALVPLPSPHTSFFNIGVVFLEIESGHRIGRSRTTYSGSYLLHTHTGSSLTRTCPWPSLTRTCPTSSLPRTCPISFLTRTGPVGPPPNEIDVEGVEGVLGPIGLLDR